MRSIVFIQDMQLMKVFHIEAKKKIDAVDVQMFNSKKYVENKDFSDKANAELRAYNTKMYVSREKLLQAQLDLLSHMLLRR